MSNLTILNTSIRSLNNLYSLNDLHRVSGGEMKHQPSNFIRLDTTQGLIEEIEKDRSSDLMIAHKTVRGGRNPELQGTWACEELALAYATWISPKFHLVVLRAFIAMHKGETLQKNHEIRPLVEPEPIYHSQFNKKEIRELVWLLFSHEQMRLLLGSMIKPLEAIGSRYSGAVYGNYTEYKRHYDKCLPIIRSLVVQLKQDNPQEWERLNSRLNNF